MCFEEDFGAASKEWDEAASHYNNLLKKMDAMQEEWQLKGR